jgi:hypothetical protein
VAALLDAHVVTFPGSAGRKPRLRAALTHRDAVEMSTPSIIEIAFTGWLCREPGGEWQSANTGRSTR